MSAESNLKSSVQSFWNEKSCGETYASGDGEFEYYETHRAERYRLEPYLVTFAKFADGVGKDVLEIGVGMGADHIEWGRSNPKSLTGIDLTPRAIEHTEKRAKLYGISSTVRVADAESLPFNTNSFDLVYSYGVLHHSPDTPKAIQEVLRVLRPGGVARIMIYHKYSLTGYMLWIRYALLRLKPFTSLREIYAKYLESPGTKAYSVREARLLFTGFANVNTSTCLSFGDLLEGSAGQRHKGIFLTTARALWPRTILRKLFKNHGLILLIEASK